MVNHLRTLLLNEPRDSSAGLEQYISPDFVTIPLPPAAAAVRNLLIQPEWPREYRNYVATLLATVPSGTPHENVLNKLDPRSTLDSSSLPTSLEDKVVVDRILNAGSVQVVGRFHSSEPKGVFHGSWRIKKSGFTGIEITDLLHKNTRQVTPIFTGDVCQTIPLDPQNLLYFQLMGVSSVPSFVADIRASNAMSYSLMDALERLQGSERALSVFHLDRHQETLKVLHDSFENSGRPDQSLAAILIAYALYLS